MSKWESYERPMGVVHERLVGQRVRAAQSLYAVLEGGALQDADVRPNVEEATSGQFIAMAAQSGWSATWTKADGYTLERVEPFP